MKRFLTGTTAFILAAAAVLQTGCSAEPSKLASPYSTSLASYIKASEPSFALDLAGKISGCKENEKLGFRTAGTQAESNAGDIIFQQMQAIGLSGVEKKSFPVDTWSFQTGQLSYKSADGASHFFDVASYQTTLETEGIKHYDLVYASATDAGSLGQLKPQGKFILIDANPDNLRFIAEQARLLGADGVITAGDGSPDAITLENQEVSIPVLSIAPKDAGYLKSALQTANYVAPVKKKASATYTSDKSIAVGLEVTSRVSTGGTSNNIVGSIPGVHADQMLLVTASYDSYFDGFSNSSATGMMLAMAKAVLTSGYRPDKTIVFVAQAADKWGLSGKLYDWGQGGFSQLFAENMHPEWASKTTAVLQIEAPAFDMGDKYTLRSSYELSSFVTEAVGGLTSAIYPGGVSVVSPRTTKGGDFTYSVSGIPSVGADLSGQGYQAIVDSSLDNSKQYNQDAMTFSLNLYGTLLMRLDQTAISPIDLSPVLTALKSSLNAGALTTAGVGIDKLNTVIDQASEQAVLFKQLIWKGNKDYQAAIDDRNTSQASKLYANTRSLYAESLALYKRVQSLLTRVDINGGIAFPHQCSQANVNYLSDAISALGNGNVQSALTTIAKIDGNRLYIYYQDEVYDYFNSMIGTQTKNESKWSLNIIEDRLDLGTVVNSLQTKVSGKNLTSADLANEISGLQTALKEESALLSQQTDAIAIGVGILADETAKAVGDEGAVSGTVSSAGAASLPVSSTASK